ncbi:MAG: M28 family peptidase [Candidatus Promineifilaceae bacterium]
MSVIGASPSLGPACGRRPSTRLRLIFILLVSLTLPACGRLAAGPGSGLSNQETATPRPSPSPTPTPAPLTFDGQQAFTYLSEQMEFGPRWPGSPGHAAVGDYIVARLGELGWQAVEMRFEYQGVPARNILAEANAGAGPVIMFGAHYDSRKIADQSPPPFEPVPGAVDGASGVAVLLELARTLDLEMVENEVWLAFFDVEDQGGGGMPGFDWIAGSAYMARTLTELPSAMVLVDMIGDADQQLYYEGNSDPTLREEIWAVAAELGYGQQFVPQVRHTMTDDHIPFARRGVPAVDIIDFDYPYWHTAEDTADKASPESLMRVGQTLELWLEAE